MTAWIAFVGVVVSVILAGGISWVSARRQRTIEHENEHKRWVRERRFEAIVRAAQLTDRVRYLKQEVEQLQASAAAAGQAGQNVAPIQQRLQQLGDESVATMREVVDASAPIGLLGPQSVVDALNAVALAMDGTGDFSEADNEFIRVAREALSIDG